MSKVSKEQQRDNEFIDAVRKRADAKIKSDIMRGWAQVAEAQQYRNNATAFTFDRSPDGATMHVDSIQPTPPPEPSPEKTRMAEARIVSFHDA